MVNEIDERFARLRAYSGSSISERRAMIADYYERLRAEQRARYEARHGAGSAERDHAALLAEPMPERLSVDMGRCWDRAGFWEYGR